MTTTRRPCILIAAGGTGGHIFPGLATAAALKEKHPELLIEFIGTYDRLETKLVPDAGWTLHKVHAAKFSRKLDMQLLKLVPNVFRGVRQISNIMGLKDRFVVAAVGFGGYTSFALGIAAKLRGIPMIIHEQNAIPGLTNKVLAKISCRVGTTYKEAYEALGLVPPKGEITGNPIRPELLAQLNNPDVRNSSIYRKFGLLEDTKTLLVFGGSLGAKKINETLIEATDYWTRPDKFQILHVAGPQQFEAVQQAWEQHNKRGLHVQVVPFINDMADALGIADVVISRSGASTVAELTVLGIPSVLVPYPYATADHQTANAAALTNAGGAILIPESKLDPKHLVVKVQPLLDNTDGCLDEMAANAKQLGVPDAADRLADLVLGIASRF